MRTFAIALFLCLLTTTLLAQDRPNIIYIMIDDAGYQDFGAMGSTAIQTPHFDALCQQGTRFTNHYCGSAVCAPTRCVLMTGLHTGHCKRRDNEATANPDQLIPSLGNNKGKLIFLDRTDVTIASELQQAGYETIGIGKWGLGNPGTGGQPDSQGFGRFFGYLDQVHAHDHFSDYIWNNGDMPLIQNRKNSKEVYIPDLMEQETLKFINGRHRRPFFMYLPYTLPHGDFEIPADDPACELYADKPWSAQVKNYASMVTRVDRTVGLLLKALDEKELAQNTIIFYTSDNGPNPPFIEVLDSNGPLRGIKRELYEGGIRSAMAVRWPDHVPAGKTSDAVWGMVDVFPTLCDIAGIKTPKNLDGISVRPLLEGQADLEVRPYYWEIYHPFQQAVRMGPWKAIRFGTLAPLSLYNLELDIAEENDVAQDNPEVVAQIEKIMAEQHVDSQFYPTVEKPAEKTSKRKKAASKKDDTPAES